MGIEIRFIRRGIYLLHFMKQHLTAFEDLVYWYDLEKRPCIFASFFQLNFPPMQGAHLQGPKSGKHSGHQIILFLFIN